MGKVGAAGGGAGAETMSLLSGTKRKPADYDELAAKNASLLGR